MRILGVDPGGTVGWVHIVIRDGQLALISHGETPDWREIPGVALADLVAVEGVESRGMVVGQDTFDTAWIGGEVCGYAHAVGCSVVRIMPRVVRLELTGSTSAKGSAVRRATMDRFPATGRGAIPQVGTKAHPGPLYGMKGRHAWSALAVAVVAAQCAEVTR